MRAQNGQVATNGFSDFINVMKLAMKFFGRTEQDHRIGKLLSKPREGIASNMHSGSRGPEEIKLGKVSGKKKILEKRKELI